MDMVVERTDRARLIAGAHYLLERELCFEQTIIWFWLAT
jgi:hypothetical protein